MTCYRAGIIREDDGSGCSVYFPDVPNVAALDARARGRYPTSPSPWGNPLT